MPMNPSRVRAIINSEPMIQGRLLPMERMVKLSIKGAHISLKDHGTRMMALRAPISPSEIW